MAQHLIIFGCLSYALGLLAFFSLRNFETPAQPFVTLVNAFLPFAFAPLGLALPLALLTRSRLAIGSALSVAVIFAGVYGDYVLPFKNSQNPAGRLGLQVMNFNLGPGQAQPEQLVAVIRRANADVVAVEELTPAIAAHLQTDLSEQYPYMLLDPQSESVGVLSRYPIFNAQWRSPTQGGRSYLHAQLAWHAQLIHLVIVHPFPPEIVWYGQSRIPIGLRETEASQTIAEVAQWVKTLDGPKMVVGDFNMSDQTPAYAQLRAVLHDAYREAGWGLGFTFPNNLHVDGQPVPGPFVRIDYIFHSADLLAQEAYVDCGGSSDHCYLVARLGWGQ